MREDAGKRYQEREKRFNDIVALRMPDRVPIMVSWGFLPAFQAGMTVQDLTYDPDKLWTAQWALTLKFQPDMEQNPFPLRLVGPVLEALDFRQLRWAGHGLGMNTTYQFVEAEYMKASEYDWFFDDPSDFMFRHHLPRICGRLKGLEGLPPLRNFMTYYMGIPFGLIPFTSPEMAEALNALREAGNEAVRLGDYSRRFAEKAKEEGFPLQFGGMTQAPFDTLGDFLRGTKGLMLDMYRQPDKVIRACEKLLPYMFEMAVGPAKASGNPRVFIPLHKGLDGFMSLDQFKKFFWPTLRELMVALIREGLVPCPFWEGNCESRLEVIKDIPAGKACYKFEATNMAKAKEVLGETVSIRGNVPLSILVTGTPEDVRQYCRKLIDTAGKGGGFILDASTGLDDAKIENVQAMFDVTREYGIY
jgi:uroporphyrinogen-III decarboxylase